MLPCPQASGRKGEKEKRGREGAREREANVSMERKERALSFVPCDMS